MAKKPESNPHLESMQRKLVGLRDDVASVALGYVSGAIIWGPAGTGKTWNIKSQLSEMNVAWREPSGSMTAKALFLHLQRYPDDVTVVEDQEAMLRDKKALSILRAALWTTDRDTTNRGRIPDREVNWLTARGREELVFGGGIILTQNGAPPQTPEVAAVLSRIIPRHLGASTDELSAMMRHVAATAPQNIMGCNMSPKECGEVADFLIAESLARGRLLNMKLLDTSYRFYVQHQQGDSAQHWQDRVISLVLERAPKAYLHDVDISGATRRERQERDREIVRGILETISDPKEQVRLWRDRTAKGQSMFYERKKEVNGLS